MDSIHLEACVKLIGRWNCVETPAAQGEMGHVGNHSFALYASAWLPLSLLRIIIQHSLMWEDA